MNKRGFGLVQIISIIAMALITIVFLFLIILQPESVDDEKQKEVSRVYAAIVLDNVLALPVDTPPQGLIGLTPAPTIADYIAFANESEFLGLEKQVADVLGVVSGDKLYYWFTWHPAGFVTNMAAAASKHEFVARCRGGNQDVLEVQRSITRGATERTVVLSMCGVFR